MIEFLKMHGLGNDFIIFDWRGRPQMTGCQKWPPAVWRDEAAWDGCDQITDRRGFRPGWASGWISSIMMGRPLDALWQWHALCCRSRSAAASAQTCTKADRAYDWDWMAACYAPGGADAWRDCRRHAPGQNRLATRILALSAEISTRLRYRSISHEFEAAGLGHAHLSFAW